MNAAMECKQIDGQSAVGTGVSPSSAQKTSRSGFDAMVDLVMRTLGVKRNLIYDAVGVDTGSASRWRRADRISTSKSKESMSIVTKDGITVKFGQTWRDLDARSLPRTVQVTDVSEAFNKAVVKNTKTGKVTALAISRMYKHATGWALVSEPKA